MKNNLEKYKIKDKIDDEKKKLVKDKQKKLDEESVPNITTDITE